jgi:hypothetical protein
MKKQRVSPATNLVPSVFKSNIELPTPEAVNKAVAEVTGKTAVIEKPKEAVKPKVEKQIMSVPKVEKARNIRKRETLKGTILQAVMLEKDLLKMVKKKAFEDEKSLSEVVNNALKIYFQ